MSAPVAEPAQWWTSDRTERVNHGTGSGAVRTVRLAHLVRHGHTLCGRDASAFTWRGADTGTDPLCSGCTAVGADRYIHRDLTKAAGITYRQLDVWIREGLVHPENPEPGCGRQRVFTAPEFAVVRLMGVLVTAGLRPAAAAQVARTGHLAPGIRVLVDEPALAAP
jgi:hypothetical protein